MHIGRMPRPQVTLVRAVDTKRRRRFVEVRETGKKAGRYSRIEAHCTNPVRHNLSAERSRATMRRATVSPTSESSLVRCVPVIYPSPQGETMGPGHKPSASSRARDGSPPDDTVRVAKYCCPWG